MSRLNDGTFDDMNYDVRNETARYGLNDVCKLCGGPWHGLPTSRCVSEFGPTPASLSVNPSECGPSSFDGFAPCGMAGYYPRIIED